MAHGYLSYQDTRGEVDWLGKVINRVSDYLENREKKEKVADMVAAKVNILNDQKTLPPGETPLLRGSDNPSLPGSPLQKMLSGSALQRSLPGGAMAVNPDVVGGAATLGVSPRKRLTAEGFVGDKIVDIGATNLGVERDLDGDDMFVKRLNTIDGGMGGGSGEVVQAIDRLTFVTMSLVAATKEQTNQQKMIAAAQQQQAEKLARDAKSAAEESALEGGADLSGNLAYERLALAGGAAMGGGGAGGRGGGPGMGIGGKVLAKNIMKSATKRGAARTGTRLGAAIGGKMMGGLGARMGAKLGAKSVGKVAGSAIAKSIGKKIPLVGLGLGAIFAAQRAMQGDFVGAGLELASGAASTVPGIGTAGSVGIDAALAARDMTMMADGGIVDSATNAIIGEDGKEGVFPLEGSRGKKTFLQFGEGILEAQRKNRKQNAKMMAEGLKEYYENQSGWDKFMEGLATFMLGIAGAGKNVFDAIKNFFGLGKKDGDTPTGAARINLDDVDISATEKSGAIGRVLPTAKGQAPPTATPHNSDPSRASNFGEMRGNKMHMGADIGMDANSPVTAIQDGKVVDAYGSGFGLHGGAVVVKHDDGSAYVYGHVTPNVKTGDTVKAGEKIAKLVYYPSPDGTQDYTHLHLERYQKHGDRNSAIDPIAHMAKENINPARVQKSLEEEAQAGANAQAAAAAGQPQSAQDISQNFGLKAHDKFMFQHEGGMYEAYKTEKGFDIYKHAGNLIPQKLDTSGGKNAGVVKSLIEAGTKRTSDADKLSSASADTATTVAAKSSENAVAYAAPAAPQVTVVQSQGSSSRSGGNQAAAIPAGISSSDTGTELFQATKILNA